ncbi:MAG TPA: hypothetical protein VHA53_06055, partial [Nitrolancea sp.]|nr:hypothetical protein [Nitrolancea sp.]
PGALAFLVLAVVAPELVRGVGLHWPFRLLPRSSVAEPRRFAATLALVVIPISGIAGLGVYRSVLFDGGNSPVTPPPVAAMAVAPTATASIATPTAMAIAITPTPTQVVPTPTPATPSPTPSQAPTSAATPVPPTKQLAPAKLTAAQQSYLADLYAKWRIIDNSNDSYNQLIDQLQADTSLISNPAWQQQMTSQLAIWQSVYEAAKNGSAPAGLEIINGKWIEFLGHKNLAADKLSRGIKQLDIGLIDQGQAELDTAADVSWKLDGLLEGFLAQFDGTTDVYSS